MDWREIADSFNYISMPKGNAPALHIKNIDFAGKGKVVGAAGFELATYGTQNRRATRLRYAPTFLARR